MKSTSMNTHMGSIAIDNEVIAQYAGAVANECFGIVGMANVNMAEGLVSLLKKDRLKLFEALWLLLIPNSNLRRGPFPA